MVSSKRKQLKSRDIFRVPWCHINYFRHPFDPSNLLVFISSISLPLYFSLFISLSSPTLFFCLHCSPSPFCLLLLPAIFRSFVLVWKSWLYKVAPRSQTSKYTSNPQRFADQLTEVMLCQERNNIQRPSGVEKWNVSCLLETSRRFFLQAATKKHIPPEVFRLVCSCLRLGKVCHRIVFYSGFLLSLEQQLCTVLTNIWGASQTFFNH